MDSLWDLEKRVARIVCALDDLDQMIEAADGEITPEIQAAIDRILDGPVNETIADLVHADAHLKGREHAANLTKSAADVRVKGSKRKQRQARALICRLLEAEVNAGREGKVWTTAGTASRVVRKTYKVYDSDLLPERFRYKEEITKYKTDEARKAAKAGESVPGVEKVTTISAQIRRG
jgi:hypothetical protein